MRQLYETTLTLFDGSSRGELCEVLDNTNTVIGIYSWSGDAWESVDLDPASNIELVGTPSTNDIVRWNGSNWIPDAESASLPHVVKVWEQANVYPGDMTQDSAAGLQAMWAANPNGTTYLYGPYGYRHDSQLYLDMQGDSDQRFNSHIGANAKAGDTFVRTSFVYYGTDATKPAFLVCSDRNRFEGILFACRSGAIADGMLEINKKQAGDSNRSNNFNSWRDCEWDANGGTFNYLVGVYCNHPSGSVQGENNTFLDCFFNLRFVCPYALKIGGGQPYSTVLERCTIFGGSNSTPYGCGIYSHIYSSSTAANDCDFQQLEEWFDLGSGAKLTVNNPQSEHCKRIGTNSSSVASTVVISGGRQHTYSFTGAASGGPKVLAATDGHYLYLDACGSASLNGLHITDDTGAENNKARVKLGNYSNLTAIGCTFPGRDVFDVDSSARVTNDVTLIDCRAFVDGTLVRLHDSPRNGRVNGSGEVAFYGPGQTARVPLHRTEADNKYSVKLSVREAAGNPAFVTARCTNRQTTYFDIELSGDPGATTADGVIVSWEITQGEPSYSTLAASGWTVLADWDARAGLGSLVDGDPVVNWVDQVNGHTLAATGVTYRASRANLNGLPALELFTGDSLISSEAASVWAGLSDGNPWTVLVCCEGDGNNYTLSTKSTSDTQRGMLLFFGDAPTLMVGSGSAYDYYELLSSSTTKRWICATYRGSAHPDPLDFVTNADRVNNAKQTTVEYVAGNPERPLGLRVNAIPSASLYVTRIIILGKGLHAKELDSLLTGLIVPTYGTFSIS